MLLPCSLIFHEKNPVLEQCELTLYTNKCQVTDVKGGEMMKKFHLLSAGVFLKYYQQLTLITFYRLETFRISGLEIKRKFCPMAVT